MPLGDEARKIGIPLDGLLLALVGGLVQKRCQPNSYLLHELLENNNCELLKPLFLDKLRKVSSAALT